MQCMPSLKSSPIQAIQLLTILVNSYPLLEELIDRFCHGFANFDGLKRRQLWLNPCHCWLTHKNGLLRASQGYYWCPRSSRSYYQRSNEASRPPRLNCHQPKVAIHLEIRVIALLFPWHKVETLYRLPFTNGRLDQKAE